MQAVGAGVGGWEQEWDLKNWGKCELDHWISYKKAHKIQNHVVLCQMRERNLIFLFKINAEIQFERDLKNVLSIG